jgi:O-antigen ligase
MGAIPLYQQVTKNFKNDFGGFGQTTEIGFRTGEVSSEGEVRQVRLCGPIGEQNRYAQNLLMILPLGFFLHGNSRSKGLRLLALACTGFTFAGLVLSFSRGAAVALMLLVGIAMFLRLIKTRQIIFALLAAAALLVVMPQYLLRLSSIGSIRGFFEDDVGAADEPDGAIKGRVTEMLAAAQVFLDYPVVGVGPGMFKYYSQDYGNKLGIRRLKQTRQAHSLYLDLAAENGALGLLTFSGVIFFSLSRLARVRRRWAGVRPDLSNAATAYMLAVIAYLATGIFLHMSYVRFFYLVLALASAASRAGEIEENAAGAPEAPRPDPLVAAPSPRMLEKLA